MIRHVALFTLREDAPAGTTRSLEEGLAEVEASIEEISAYSYGADLGLRSGSYDFGVVADFTDVDDFRRYVDHPVHQGFIRERLTPVLKDRVSIQFEL